MPKQGFFGTPKASITTSDGTTIKQKDVKAATTYIKETYFEKLVGYKKNTSLQNKVRLILRALEYDSMTPAQKTAANTAYDSLTQEQQKKVQNKIPRYVFKSNVSKTDMLNDKRYLLLYKLAGESPQPAGQQLREQVFANNEQLPSPTGVVKETSRSASQESSYSSGSRTTLGEGRERSESKDGEEREGKSAQERQIGGLMEVVSNPEDAPIESGRERADRITAEQYQKRLQ